MAHIEHRGKGTWRARYRGLDNRERSQTFPTKREAQQCWMASKYRRHEGYGSIPRRGVSQLRR